MLEPPRRRRILEMVAWAATLGAASVGIAVTLGSGSSPSCASYPACLLAPSNLLAGVHAIGAGILLLLEIVAFTLALSLRRDSPQLTRWAGAALLVLIAMAALGSAFADAVVPTTFADVQYGFLGAFLVGNVGLAWAARRSRRVVDPPSAAGA